MSKETAKRWLVKVGYYYPDEATRDTLDMDVQIFRSEAAAVEALNAIIRSIWTAEVECEGRICALADCRGKAQGYDDKRDDWSYSEDGKRAWCFFDDGHGYKGEVKEVEI